MILPSTYVSALLLLIVSLLCLGSWPNTFKLSGTRWRFELFSIDFAIGALLFSVITAFTLGTMGSDLAFTDRMLVAGRTAQAMAIAAGAIFNLGNMLLLAAISILGLAGAFPLSLGLALVIGSCFDFRPGKILYLAIGMLLMIVSVVLDGSACRLRDEALARARKAANLAKTAASAKPPSTDPGGTPASSRASVKTPVRPAPTRKSRRTTKGLVVAILSGIALGLFYPVAERGVGGEFGLGPYAGLLLFSIGVLGSTVVLNFYFLNIAIEGEPLSLGAYFRGGPRQHFFGFAGGALCAAGLLTASAGAVPQAQMIPALALILPTASVLLAMFWGVTAWKEFAAAPAHAKLSLGLTAVFFICGLILLGIGSGVTPLRST